MQAPGGDKTSLADKPVWFHATYSVEMSGRKFTLDGQDVGDKIRMYTTKNKLSDKHREVTLYLVRNKGFDFCQTDADFLIGHPASPFAGAATRNSHGVKCPPLSEKNFKTDQDFLDAFYADKDMVQAFREKLRIRGFNFDFETRYMPTIDQALAKEEEPDYNELAQTDGASQITESTDAKEG
jgi:hypothetical protein